MNQPPVETSTTTTTTFVVRLWHAWSGAEARWRGRIEHVESGQHADFLGLESLVSFLERFGVSTGARPSQSGTGRSPHS